MSRECRHLHHEVQPQRNVWRGEKFKKVDPAQVYCADCKAWLYEKLINWDLVPKNKIERREARIDDSRSSSGAADGADQHRSRRHADAG